ncbi:MAG: hypothetical protein U9Q69_02800 [Nanoarchaeota archaeon]|nr:hypothetical protein [Nanoarchaeota archaeon]
MERESLEKLDNISLVTLLIKKLGIIIGTFEDEKELIKFTDKFDRKSLIKVLSQF